MIPFPDLPYERDALEPYLSKEAIAFHYGKHHRSYVDKTNALIEGGDYGGATLEEIVRATRDRDETLFNNAAQAWNHDFYWRSMSPGGGGPPKGEIATLIERSFGGYDNFATAFVDAGSSQFGSGWIWLVNAADQLEIRATSNAQTPLTDGVTPLITMDVWEHAYYLDYQNRRKDYIASFLDHLVNWEFAGENLSR